jgi:hypothetical protein
MFTSSINNSGFHHVKKYWGLVSFPCVSQQVFMLLSQFQDIFLETDQLFHACFSLSLCFHCLVPIGEFMSSHKISHPFLTDFELSKEYIVSLLTCSICNEASTVILAIRFPHIHYIYIVRPPHVDTCTFFHEMHIYF